MNEANLQNSPQPGASPASVQKSRWQMILAAGPDSPLGEATDPQQQAQLETLTFLYDREYKSRNVRPGSQGQPAQGWSGGSSDPSQPASESSNEQGNHRNDTSGEEGQRSPQSSPSSAADRHEETAAEGRSASDANSAADSDSAHSNSQQPGAQVSGGIPGATVGSPNVQGTQREDGSGDGPDDGPGDGLGEGAGDVGARAGDRPEDSRIPSQSRQGGIGPSRLTVPEWINAVHELFPKKTIERLEKDALERYQLEELVTDADLLSRVEPSQTLLKAVLRTKHLMNPAVLEMAHQLVQRVIAELMESLAQDIKAPFSGALNRQQRSFLKIAKNFDPDTTIRQNLSTYDLETKKLYIKTPYFFSRIRRQIDRWQLIIVVDESGSMLDSVIHAAVTASIFYRLQNIRTHLCIFDTEVVDLTDRCSDPVETLMQVQLGGGTDIARALTYAGSLVTNPRNTIVILITDFFEGGPAESLYRVASNLIESGVTLLGLAALDADATPNYNPAIAQELVNRGAHIGAMTPGELAEWVAKKVRS